jgi:uncharacterized protein (TIGR02001 family)
MKTKAWKAGLFGAVALASFAPAAQADEEGAWGPFSAGATLTNDYRFRGQSQSDRGGAVQGWVQYDHKSGFFANIWGSYIDFNDAGVNTTDDTNAEVDLTVGYNHSFSEQTSGTIKAVYYWYPDADQLPAVNDYDYFELIGSVAHDFGTFGLNGEVAWSPDYFFETGDAISLKGGASYPIMDNFIFMGALSASANVGYQWIDQNAAFGTPDYLYFDIGATAEWGLFAIDLRWVDTDLDNGECFGGTKLCEGGVVLSITANLPG